MYHGRFKGSHYDAGYKWGSLLYNHGKSLAYCPTFKLDDEKRSFAGKCAKEYEIFFPEIIDEIKGIADGQRLPVETIETTLFSMYCFELDNRCTCFAVSDGGNIIFGRNSDFLVSLEKLYMNCLYSLEEGYAFNGNTTAYVEMEDGVNAQGLAAGLTFIYPKLRKPGISAGMLIRYLLEKCSTVQEAVDALNSIPIASQQTITLADSLGNIAVVECNAEKLVVIRPEEGTHFVVASNHFSSREMQCYNPVNIDDWRAEDRYETAYNALQKNRGSYSLQLCENILSGKYGFMCQYDRKTNADTVWSAVYDLNNKAVLRVEGNPGRKKFKRDDRFHF